VSKQITLEALVHRASRKAEKMFNKHGGFDMFWLVDSQIDGQGFILSPVIEQEQESGEVAQRIRTLFRDRRVWRYVQVTEAWTLNDPNDAVPAGTLANHPDRKEIVMLNASDGRESIVGIREIVRPERGKPYLAKLEIMPSGCEQFGRFSDMLKDIDEHVKCSWELPDDEGDVFVTNVPDAPFQVFGRRDPETGELCFHCGFSRQDGQSMQAMVDGIQEMADMGVEVVADDNAKRLIERIARKQHRLQ
jgi:hypothetical protein